MFVYPWLASDCTWRTVENVWDRWQSLNVGMLAFVSSITAFNIGRYNAEKQREREFMASKAFLPDALSGLASYFADSAVFLREGWEASRGDSINTALPIPPPDFKVVFRDCIRHADREVGEYLARILRRLQVHAARLATFVDQQSDDTWVSPHKYNLVSLLRGNLLKIDRNKSIESDLVFGYFGTISHWFDWSLVLRILENLPRARLRLAGPVETHIPQHPRIEYVGIFPHSALTEFVEDCNAFIMPFIVNPLIEAVDPVKLYEYIAYGLPTLAPRYPETERFLPWVNLYSDIDEAINISKSLLKTSSDKMTMEQRYEFLESNSWTIRCRKISEAMAKL